MCYMLVKIVKLFLCLFGGENDEKIQSFDGSSVTVTQILLIDAFFQRVTYSASDISTVWKSRIKLAMWCNTGL